MRRLVLALGIVACGALAPVAAADPGALDSAFGSGGVIRLTDGNPLYSLSPVVSVLADGRTTWRDGAHLPLVVRPGAATDRRHSKAIDVTSTLADGSTFYLGPTSIVRRSLDGRPLAGFGTGGEVALPAFGGARRGAIAPDGRIAIASQPPNSFGSSLVVYAADGMPDTSFAPRHFDDAVVAVSFDAAGRLLATTAYPSRPNVVRRLLPNGSDDPSWTVPTVGAATDVLTGPTPGTPLVLAVEFLSAQLDLLHPDGTPFSVAFPAGDYGSSVQAFDASGRILVANTDRLLRISADGRQVTTLVAHLRWHHRRLRVGSIAVDAQQRIVLGGRLLSKTGLDPVDCGSVCREDEATFTPVLARLEGGVRRIAIASRRLGATLVVRCLLHARCRGSVRVDRGARHVLRRRVDLAGGASLRVSIPRAARRGARSVRVYARVIAGGQLATARRTLRR